MQEADIVRISLSLLLIVCLILLSAWLAKRSGFLRAKGPQRIEILSSQSVGSRTNLVLVHVAGQQLLIGVSPQHISTLHRFAVPLDTTQAPSVEAPAVFSELLRRRQQNKAP